MRENVHCLNINAECITLAVCLGKFHIRVRNCFFSWQLNTLRFMDSNTSITRLHLSLDCFHNERKATNTFVFFFFIKLSYCAESYNRDFWQESRAYRVLFFWQICSLVNPCAHGKILNGMTDSTNFSPELLIPQENFA